MSDWKAVDAPLGWRKRNFDSRFVPNPRTGQIDFIATKPANVKMPKERTGRRWRILECQCGAKRTIVAWKNQNGRRLYSLSDIDWAKGHQACGTNNPKKARGGRE